MTLGHSMSTDLKRTLYSVCNTPWDQKKPGMRVLELKRVFAETLLCERLEEWVRAYSDQGRLLDRIDDPAALVRRACTKAKNGVAEGRSIAEAVSYGIADCVFRRKPFTNFAKLKHDIRQVVDEVLSQNKQSDTTEGDEPSEGES